MVDTLVLAELASVEVKSQRLLEPSYKLIWKADEFGGIPANNLSDLLTTSGGIFLKTYGFGSLATSSFRGGAAGHTAVFWNGLPLESPMLGLLDLSLLPINTFSSIEVRPGGQSAGWGSGAIAGAIHLNNAAAMDVGSAGGVSLKFGSFGTAAVNGYGTCVSPNQKWQSISRIYRTSARNNFTYKIGRSDDLIEQSNANFEQRGFLQEVYFRPRANEEFALRVWGQEAEREIPPTTTQRSSTAFQEDDFLRLGLSWHKQSANHQRKANFGLFRELLDYRDPTILLRSISHFWRAGLELEDHWQLNEKNRLLLGLSSAWLQAETAAYGDPPTQLRIAPFVGFRHVGKFATVNLNLRQESVDGRLLPPMPAAELALNLTPKLKSVFKVSRNYRLPTFNDLYWQPGGNPDLEPEEGWSQELGLVYAGGKNLKWQFNLTAYHRNLSNWIQWAPSTSGNFWSAFNLTRVRSRGLEPRATLQQAGKYFSWQLKLGYDYVRSTNEVAVSVPLLEAGQQLIYVPEQQAFAQFTINSNWFTISYQHRYTDEVNGQRVATLPAYNLGNLNASVNWGDRWQFQVFGSIENLWNTEYRIIERRPMPGRFFTIGLKTTFAAQSSSN